MDKKDTVKNGANNGGNNNFYAIETWVKDVDDLAEQLEASGNIFNILKACFSTKGNRHQGTSIKRDAKKMVHYSVRHLMSILRKGGLPASKPDIYIQLLRELSPEDKVLMKQLMEKDSPF